jgi:hypothetical protein
MTTDTFARDITIGSGHVIVGGVAADKQGICIYYKPNHGQPVDGIVPEDISLDNLPQIRIWFKDKAAVRMFQDQINAVALSMNSYVVENAAQTENVEVQ